MFSLFPTVEEQVESIAKAQAEDRQTAQQQFSIPAETAVPDAVIDRALTSGGNKPHSIERIVAFFQKAPTGSTAASFIEKEFGEGGKGVKIAGQDYALWFSSEGLRIAPGRSAFGPGSTLVTWVNTAVMVNKLLRDGMFATQEKIDAAPDNEVRELAEKLWYLRQDFSAEARERNLLPTISQHFIGKGFPDDTKEIAKLLKEPASRQQIVRELMEFVNENGRDQDLLRFKRLHDPKELLTSVANLFTPPQQFQAVEGFAPARANFITEDEIDHLLQRGGNISESKLRIYSYFIQGHNAKECAEFLKESYGVGGHSSLGYDESHDTKGIKFTREDEISGFNGYDTVTMNWNQVQKRVRALIDSGQYLNEQEKAHLPVYDKLELARKIYAFNYFRPDSGRTTPRSWDPKESERVIEQEILPLLDDPAQVEKLFNRMLSDYAPISPDTPHYVTMQYAIRDMAAYQRGESPLFTPLPQKALNAERRVLQAEKEAKREKARASVPAEPQRSASEAPPAPGDRLAAAARALAKKRPAEAQEDQGGQFSLFSTAEPVSLETEPPVPAPEVQPPVLDQAPEREQAPDADYFDGYKAIKEANPDSIVLYHTGDFYEMYGEDAKTAAALLGLNLTTRATAGDRVEMCGFPVRNLDTALLDKLRQTHAVTITLYDPTKEKHMAYTMQALHVPMREPSVPQPETQRKRPGRTKPELNYRKFAKLFPEVASGEYRYLKLEAGESMMPLHLEWIDTDVIAVSHTYTQNGDLMRDPEMTFRVDREKGTLEPLTFRQDGSIQLYQEVYPEPGRWTPKLRRDLNTFAQQWLNNISQQRYQKREATVVRDGEDVRLTVSASDKM